MGKYTWSSNESDELWQHDCFDTVDECIKDAKENYGYAIGETIAIGETASFVVNIDAERVLENLEEDAYEECGEAAERWIDYKKGSLNKLSEKLTQCVNEWLKETEQEPSFYHITDTRVEVIK